MNRSSVVCLCAATLVAGVLIGARGEFGSFSGHAHANALDPAEAEKVFNELRGVRSPMQEGSEFLAKVVRLTTDSVVHIQSARRTNRRGLVEETGSGVIVESEKPKGFYVVTNRHVVNDTPLNSITIHLHDGRVLNPKEVVTDKATDVAVLKIEASGLQPCRWGDSDKLEIGNFVMAMGSPFGLSQSVSLGIISAKGRRSLKLGETTDVINQDFLQTDAAINPGNSGGPLINMLGQIVGINTAIASNSGGNEGIGFSIPSNLVRTVVEQLLLHGKVTRAYLGVKLDPEFDAETALRLKLERVRGARVLEVYPDTPASRANLQFDDVVLKFDSIEVQDESHLINLVSLTAVGKKVRMEVYRNGRHISLEVTVGDRSELERRAEAPPTEPGMGVRIRTMGMTVHEIKPELAVQLGYDRSTRGLLVLKVDRHCPLRGQVQMYDVIEEVGRQPVSSAEELESALDSVQYGESFVLTVKRHNNGQIQTQAIVWRR
jgi:serine protease Do